MGKQGSFIKKFTDIIVSLFACLLFIPVLVIAAIAIKLESSGPVFFLHERTGQFGKRFKMIKLRGMVNNALQIGPSLTQKNDPRITKVGKILRRTSLDEMPQIFNVLKGEMSIVGPRPEIPSITETFNIEQKKVFQFKPGITGISQIRGRQTLSPEERVEMEIEYYHKANFWSDLKIFFLTFKVIFTNEGNI